MAGKHPSAELLTTTMEKLGRFGWLAYLAISGPTAAFLILVVAIFLGSLISVSFSDGFNYPIFNAKLTDLHSLVAVISYPLAWLFGIIRGYRYNGWPRALIPLIVNLIPCGLMLSIVLQINSDGSDDINAWAIYFGLLVVNLVVLISLVIMTQWRSKVVKCER